MPISVIIPTFNRADFLPEAVESVLTQGTEAEVIVVDDGSTDDTQAVVDQFHSRHFRYLRQDNQGVSVARNTGFDAASGEHIMFLDSDDYLLPGTLAVLDRHLVDNPDIGVVHSDGYVVSAAGKVTGELSYYRKTRFEDSLEYFIRELPVIGIHSALVRRSALELLVGPFSALSGAEDLELWLDLKERGVHFAYLPVHTCCYRFHGSNKSVAQSESRLQTKLLWASRSWFPTLSPQSRCQFFLGLALGEAGCSPQSQSDILSDPAFLCLPRHMQADIHYQMGLQLMAAGEQSDWTRRYMRSARELAPDEFRYVVGAVVSELPSAYQKRLTACWRMVCRRSDTSANDPIAIALQNGQCAA